MTNEKSKYGIQNLKIPDLSQIQTFVHRIRSKVKPKSNNVNEVISYVMSNLYFPTIHENTPFFFGCEFDSKNQVILGDGSKLAPLHIYMTSIKMLRLLDGTNQMNMHIFHLDGTYRITINNFPLSIFGRSDSL